MDVSYVAFIANPPETPMQLFAEWHDSVIKQYTDPNLFLDVMTIANRDENFKKNKLEDLMCSQNGRCVEPKRYGNILRKYDRDGFVFVTERNTKKYTDFMKDPKVAAVFFWNYVVNNESIFRQVRVIGNVAELSEPEISEFYKEESVMAKIRSKICRCGEVVDWDVLKAKHDQTLKDYCDGKDQLPQTETYTAMRIVPSKFDFYSSQTNHIADRIKYTLDDGKWTRVHIAA